MKIYRRILHRMINVSSKRHRDNRNTFYPQKRFYENGAVYQIISKNAVETDRPQKTTWQRVASWIIKATQCKRPWSCSYTHTYAYEDAPTRTHARSEVCNTIIFFSATMVLCYVIRTVPACFTITYYNVRFIVGDSSVGFLLFESIRWLP
jgi:hypothetical protein